MLLTHQLPDTRSCSAAPMRLQPTVLVAARMHLAVSSLVNRNVLITCFSAHRSNSCPSIAHNRPSSTIHISIPIRLSLIPCRDPQHIITPDQNLPQQDSNDDSDSNNDEDDDDDDDDEFHLPDDDYPQRPANPFDEDQNEPDTLSKNSSAASQPQSSDEDNNEDRWRILYSMVSLPLTSNHVILSIFQSLLFPIPPYGLLL